MKKFICLFCVFVLMYVNNVSSLDFGANHIKIDNDIEYWGVVVTIVDYEDDRNDLNIPVDMIYTPLIQASNWDEQNVLFVKNENATIENILKSLDWLRDQLDENDIAFFYYGGHGQRKDDLDGDELDGIDECITTYESGGYIIDDELKLKFDNISAEGLIIFIDCCLSAGVVDFDNEIQEELKGSNRVVIASTFEKAVALEVKGFGTVLTLSLEHIISKSKGDINQDNIISVEEVYFYLKRIFRRLNFFVINGVFILLKLVKSILGIKALITVVLTGLAAVLLWEMFSYFVYGGLMIPYYPIMTDDYEGELPFLEK